ncbi:hypothetical protein EV715DRAFT_298032 [Schizophyllum commune]
MVFIHVTSHLIDLLQVAADADAQCALCHHRYFEHESSLDEILSQVSAIFRKAGIAGLCGGMVYFAHMPLTGSTPCPGCKEPLCAHGPPPTAPAPPPANATPSCNSPRPPSQDTRTLALGVVLPPPALPGRSSLAITSTTGATRAFPDFVRPANAVTVQAISGDTTPSSVNATRLQTAARTLHPPQAVAVDVRGSGSSRSRRARHPPAGTVVDAAVPPPAQLATHHVPASATGASPAATASNAGAPEASAPPPSAIPSSSSTRASTLVDLVIWPLMPDFTHPKSAHPYRLVHLRFVEEQLNAVVARLGEHQLRTTLPVDTTLSGQALQNHIFQWVFTQFRMTHIQHLDAPQDDFPEPTVLALLNAAATTAAPVEDPFVFLTVKKNTGKFMLTPVKLEDAHRLTFDSLLKLADPLVSQVFLRPELSIRVLARTRGTTTAGLGGPVRASDRARSALFPSQPPPP